MIWARCWPGRRRTSPGRSRLRGPACATVSPDGGPCFGPRNSGQKSQRVGIRSASQRVRSWPVIRQATGPDRNGLGRAAQSEKSAQLRPRTPAPTGSSTRSAPTARSAAVSRSTSRTAGHPDRGRPRLPDLARPAVPEGLRLQAARQQHRCASTRSSTARRTPPTWEELDLETAMDMIADRVIETAREHVGGARTTQGRTAAPHARRRQPRRRDARQRGELPDQEAVHGARRGLDREPGPHMTHLHRARSGRPRSAAAAPPPSSRIWPNADCILIMGSNMAECHPVGFRWVMEAKRTRRRGDPRRSAVHPHRRHGRRLRAAPRRQPTSSSSAA